MTISREPNTDVLVLPSTGKSDVLQAVRWAGKRQSVTTSATSQFIALPADIEVLEMLAKEDVYIKFGSTAPVVASSAIASDGSRLFLAGVQAVPVPIDPSTGNPYLFMGIIQKDISGVFQLEVGGNSITGFSTPPAGTDPFFANVVLLLDFAGPDGGTDITDLSNSTHVETFVGDAQIDTAVQALGENTLLLDGAGDTVTYPDSADWDFGTGDFTIECNFRSNLNAVNGVLIGTHNAPDGWILQNLSGVSLRFLHGDTSLKEESFNPVENQMYHIAVTRSGTDLRIFVDGVELGTATTDSTDFTGSTVGCILGGVTPTVQTINGHLGAVRITKGVARYTENFTPPTVFYPTS